jgi:hypothetical protein
MLHFDSAPVHNTEAIQESLANFGFRRMENPPYNPDLAPCAFFLFQLSYRRGAPMGGMSLPRKLLDPFYFCGH